MEEDYLYSSDEQIIKLVQTILGLESIEIVTEKIKEIVDKDYYKVLSVLGGRAYIQNMI